MPARPADAARPIPRAPRTRAGLPSPGGGRWHRASWAVPRGAGHADQDNRGASARPCRMTHAPRAEYGTVVRDRVNCRDPQVLRGRSAWNSPHPLKVPAVNNPIRLTPAADPSDRRARMPGVTAPRTPPQAARTRPVRAARPAPSNIRLDHRRHLIPAREGSMTEVSGDPQHLGLPVDERALDPSEHGRMSASPPESFPAP